MACQTVVFSVHILTPAKYVQQKTAMAGFEPKSSCVGSNYNLPSHLKTLLMLEK